MGKTFIWLAVCLALTGGISGAEQARISRIEINGAERTRHEVIRAGIGVSEGEIVRDREGLIRRCVAALHRMRVFGKVEVRVVEKGDGLDLVLDVQEKWTLLPIPFVAVYQKKLTLGAGVLESNFLGTLNSLGGFFFLQDGTPGFFGFSQWALDSSRSWILSFSPQWMGRDVEVWDGERKSGEYKERIGAFSMGLVHRFEGGWEFGGRVDAQWFQLGDGPYEGRYDGAPFGMTIGWNGQRVVEDRMQGFEWKVGALWDSGLFGSALRRRVGTVQWSLALPAGESGFVMLEQSGAVSDGLVPGLAYRLGGKGSQAVRQVRGYHEDQFRTTAWMVTSVEWRLQVWTTQALLGSVFPFVDHGLFRDDGRARQILSVGLGFRVYLRKVLFPAFSI